MSKELKEFQKRLNQAADEEKCKINKLANNSKYLPIGEVEKQLDEIFFGLWETENFKFDTILNELVGSIDLLVFHPVQNIWIRRTGAAAVPIMMKRGSKASDVDNKIINTLTKDFPHLKSSCIASAAKTLGRYFGRGLNRDTKYEDDAIPENPKIKEIIEEFTKCQTKDDMLVVWNPLDPELQADKEIRRQFVIFNNRLKS